MAKQQKDNSEGDTCYLENICVDNPKRTLSKLNLISMHRVLSTSAIFVCYGSKPDSHFALNLREFGVARPEELEVNQ